MTNHQHCRPRAGRSTVQRSAALVQAVTMQSLLANNIMYNGNSPQASLPLLTARKRKRFRPLGPLRRSGAAAVHCTAAGPSVALCAAVGVQCSGRVRGRRRLWQRKCALSRPSQLRRQRFAACSSACRSGLRSERVVRTLAGPRAMINFNDGFGGGSEIVNNLVLNSCRESSGALFDR